MYYFYSCAMENRNTKAIFGDIVPWKRGKGKVVQVGTKVLLPKMMVIR